MTVIAQIVERVAQNEYIAGVAFLRLDVDSSDVKPSHLIAAGSTSSA
jgi:hypothetical protein